MGVNAQLNCPLQKNYNLSAFLRCDAGMKMNSHISKKKHSECCIVPEICLSSHECGQSQNLPSVSGAQCFPLLYYCFFLEITRIISSFLCILGMHAPVSYFRSHDYVFLIYLFMCDLIIFL